MDDVPPPFGLISTGDCGNEEGCWRWMGWVDRRFWSFSFVSMVRLERQDAVPTLERGNDRSKRTLARGHNPSPSRAWPAPTLWAGVHAVKACHARETN